MKRTSITALFLLLAVLLSACGSGSADIHDPYYTDTSEWGNFPDGSFPEDPPEVPSDSDTNVPSVTPPEEIKTNEAVTALNAGRFEGKPNEVTVTCQSGTKDAYVIDGNVITFTEIKEDSVYSISGRLYGNIVINCGDGHKFDLELCGFSIISDNECPISILSGDEVSVTAKKNSKNYIYDDRSAVDENGVSYAIFSEVDTEICGKGELTVVSLNNKGIHSKKDLQIKNLTLSVLCKDNALKGDDSVELKKASATLISTAGDGIKTENSDISAKGNQRGTVTANGGTYYIYAACDGIDAAYDVVINEDTVLNIYTDKYSDFSEEVTAVAEDVYFIRFTSKNYKYSVRYSNDSGETLWVNAEYHSSVSGGRSTYYYYSFPKNAFYDKMQFFIYSSNMLQGQDEDYLVASDKVTCNSAYDTFALTSRGNSLSYSWTNYTTQINDGFGMGRPGGGGPGGFGGFGEGNKDKGEYSTKGIKAANEIVINGGTIYIKAYDDALHASNDSTLENGEAPKGNITVNGGALNVYSNDDGIHADGTLTVKSGNVTVENSYEGLEGTAIRIDGGNISVNATDDGINSTATSGTGVCIAGGNLYIYCTGDGIDSNSRTSYSGIIFEGGNVIVISNSGGNSAIDTEQGYTYNGGRILAIMPSRGMSNEATHCANFTSVATNKTASLTEGRYLTVASNSADILTLRIPASISARVIYLGDNGADISTTDSTPAQLDEGNVIWY